MASLDNVTPVYWEQQKYPDPWLDIASTKLPKSFSKLLQLCEQFALSHPQISPIIWKLAEYPITELIYSGKEASRKELKNVFEEEMHIHEKQIEWGLDYFTYGNCFITIMFPFTRNLKCTSCGHDNLAHNTKYKFNHNGTFEGECKGCKSKTVKFKSSDNLIKRVEGTKIIRLEPSCITPKYNRITGDTFYYYTIPKDTRRSILSGDKDILNGTPLKFIEAAVKNKRILLNRVFHFKRPTISGKDMAWGFPMIVPALKDAYLNQLLKKTDEVIAHEHSVPMRFVFPQPLGTDPMKVISARKWKNFMDYQIKKWRHDKNAVMTSPYPVGQTQIAGDGAQYFTGQMRKFVIDEIIEAMGHSRQLLGGGLMYSAGNVNMRILENSMLSYTKRLDTALKWIHKQLRDFCNVPNGVISRKPFKMADDIQMLQLLVNMAMNNKMDWREIYDRLDIDFDDHIEQMSKEATQFGEMDADRQIAGMKVQLESAKYQAQSEQLASAWQNVTQGSINYTHDLMGQLMGHKTIEESEGERQQGQQGQQQLQSRMQEAQVAEVESKVQKQTAQAGEDKSRADVHDAWAARQIGGRQDTREQVQEIVKEKIYKRKQQEVNQVDNPKDIANQLLKATPEQQEQALQQMQTERGEGFAGQVLKHVQESRQQQQQQAEQQQQAKDPQFIAQQISQMPQEQQQQALEQLPPELAKQVVSIVQQQQQQQQQIIQIAQKLVQLSPEQQQAQMAKIEQQRPDVIQAIMQAMNSMSSQSQAQQALEEIRGKSSNLSEIAENIFILDPKTKSAVLNMLAQTNAELLSIVLNKFRELTGASSATKDINVVDMRQAPSQKPPRRKT